MHLMLVTDWQQCSKRALDLATEHKQLTRSAGAGERCVC